MRKNFLASLPERALRSLAALGGGLIYESSAVLLPAGLRRSRLYQATVARLLRIVVELVGGVKGVFADEAIPVKELLARKTAGNVVELVSLAAVGWSPIWLLAAVSDLTGGTRAYLQALEGELKAAGVLPKEINTGSFEELLAALEGTSGTLADTIDVVPASVGDLRTAWERLRENAASLPDAGRLAALFADLQAAAGREGRSLLEMSSLVALGAVRAGLQLGNTHVFAYYREALGTIAAEGLVVYLRRISRPYLAGAAGHFDSERDTLTQRALRFLTRGRRMKPRV